MDSIRPVDRRSQLVASGDLIDFTENVPSQPAAVDVLSSSGGPTEQEQPGCFQAFINWIVNFFRTIFCCGCGAQDSKPADDNNPLDNETEKNPDLLSPRKVESPAPESSSDEEDVPPKSNGSSGTPSAEELQTGVGAAFASIPKEQRATFTRSSTAIAPVDSEKEPQQKPAASNTGDFYANAGKTLPLHLQPAAPPPPVEGKKKEKKEKKKQSQEQLPDQNQDQVNSSTTTTKTGAPVVGQSAISAAELASKATNLKKAPKRKTVKEKPAEIASAPVYHQTWTTDSEAASQQEGEKRSMTFAKQILQSGKEQLLPSTPATSKHSSSKHNSSSSTSSAPTKTKWSSNSTFATSGLGIIDAQSEVDSDSDDDEGVKTKRKGNAAMEAMFLARSEKAQQPALPDEPVNERQRMLAGLLSPTSSRKNTANAGDEEGSDTESATSAESRQERISRFASGFKTSGKLSALASPTSSRHASRAPSQAPSQNSSMVNPPDRKSFKKAASIVKKGE